MDTRRATKLSDDEFQDVLHFLLHFQSGDSAPLGEDPDPRESPLKFDKIVLGNPAGNDSRDPPFLGHVQIVDLDRDGRSDVLVCDSEKSAVNWIQPAEWRCGRKKRSRRSAIRLHTQVLSAQPNGLPDIVVGCLGTLMTDR